MNGCQALFLLIIAPPPTQQGAKIENKAFGFMTLASANALDPNASTTPISVIALLKICWELGCGYAYKFMVKSD